jgi:hypothetical protein
MEGRSCRDTRHVQSTSNTAAFADAALRFSRLRTAVKKLHVLGGLPLVRNFANTLEVALILSPSDAMMGR